MKALRKSSILGGDKPEKKVKALTPEKLAVNKKLEDQVIVPFIPELTLLPISEDPLLISKKDVYSYRYYVN